MRIFQVDSFTNEPFKGNPAAVCILEKDYDDSLLQNIAMEMNLSETAFLLQVSENEYKLRWFTPEVEVKLCGHGTLAASHILWENKIIEDDKEIYYNTLSGTLIAKKKSGWIELDFPKGNLNKSNGDSILLEALRRTPISIHEGDEYYLLEFAGQEEILKIEPDFNLLKKARKKEVIVTCKSNDMEYDFISRFFAPAIGIEEDPVTGSAHCYLALYWAERLNKIELVGFQASKRTGYIKCKLQGDRVILHGKAVTILNGFLQI